VPPQAARTSTPRYLTQLRQNLVNYFDEDELRALCADLGVDFEDLPGQGKAGKARGLVAFLERRGRLSELAKICFQQRPHVSWEDTPDRRLFSALESEFVNRESELSLLNVERLRASLSPYVLISAPSGYGKSYLMRRLIATLETDAVLCQKWGYRYVDFSQQIGDPIAYVVQSITGQSSQSEPDIAADLTCKYVVQRLAEPLADSRAGRRAVLLIFDAVERLDDEAAQWLCKLLGALRKRTRSGLSEIVTVRVIVAGRNVEPFWESYVRAAALLPAPQRIELTPFDGNPIQDLVWRQGRAAQVSLDEQTVVQIASELQFLSGGHPRVICSLMEELAGQSFAIGPVAEYFEQQRERLVRKHLAPVVDGLLDAIAPRLVEAIRVLSVFRRVNANTVQALVKVGALTMPSSTDEVQLLGDLQRLHLLNKPCIQEPFYRDHLMRRILALDMAHSSKDRALYYRLNQVALELYESWIHNLGQGLPDTPLKAMQRLLSVTEWLFHALQDEAIDGPGIQAALQKHAQALAQGSATLPVADLIAQEIVQDPEMCYLLRHRLGDDGVSTVCSWLKAG
jgi:hypothetical protein